MNPITMFKDTSNTIYEHLPSINCIAKNTRALAVPAVALAALSNIPVVSGGPMAYAACMATCMTGLLGFLPACLTICAPALLAPTP